MRRAGRRVAALALCVAAMLPASLRAGDRVVQAGGIERTYRVHVPETLVRGRRAPLVVVLHGGFGTGGGAEATLGWDALADRAGFVVLYPNGFRRAWNSGRCCGAPHARNVDDVAFVDSAVRDVEKTYGTDPARVYATGISNGGMMAYRLACESTHPFAAIAPVAATLDVACARPQQLSVLHIHGLDDRNVPFAGGSGEGFSGVNYRPVEAGVDVFRRADRCAPPVRTVAGPVTTERSPCPAGRTVTLVTIAGAGHQWPGSAAPNRIGALLLHLDPPSRALDATATIWAFFAGTHS